MSKIKESYIAKKVDYNLKREITDYLDENVVFEPKDVVYFLSLVRKLLEALTDQKRSRYFSLTFFNNWCLHLKIDRENFKDLIKMSEERYLESRRIRKKKGLDPEPRGGKKSFYRMYIFEKLINLPEFRKQLASLLEEYSLSAEVVDKDEWWFKFRKKLMETLALSPYVISDKPKRRKKWYPRILESVK